MILIRVLGLDEGTHPVEIKIEAEKIPNLNDVFFGELVVEGELKYFNGRHSLDLNAACEAKLICDRSAEEYIEDIDIDIKLLFQVGTDSVKFLDDDTYDPESIIFEGNKIDITKLIADELSLALPMKRIAPKYRDKDINEIYKIEEDSNDKEKSDSPWNELNKLNFN